MKVDLQQLTQFIAVAVTKTYAGDGKEVEPWMPGFRELEYRWEEPNIEWYYRDSYSGFYLAPGREVVYLRQVPVWSRAYSGGMEPEYRGNESFAKSTFQFLKKALLRFDSTKPYKRGPDYFQEGDWEYISKIMGDITDGKGEERIVYQGKCVFSQNYGWCLILHK